MGLDNLKTCATHYNPFIFTIADMNECDLQRDMCGNGTCTNMMGSYKCECDDNFELGPNGRCQGKMATKVW